MGALRPCLLTGIFFIGDLMSGSSVQNTPSHTPVLCCISIINKIVRLSLRLLQVSSAAENKYTDCVTVYYE